ncbi:MAG: 50S ribosomal protein L21 [Fimbriimonadaceae bacterium]|nr:50S ribosomal protein L21 [Fimbriimonadaceae bacterium]
MYAIVETGGKQYRAAKDEVIVVDKLEGEEGTELTLSKVLMVVDGEGTQIGSPLVKGVEVTVEIVKQGKGPKINAFNYKPKKNERKRWGHRQPLTRVLVKEIKVS